MNVLPKGWVETTLGEVCDVLDSRRVPVNAKERAGRRGTVPYFGATGQVGWIDRPLFNEELLLLGEDGAPFLDARKPKAYLIRGPAWVNNHAHVLRARTVTSNRFLLHALNWTDYRRFVNGTTRLKLTQAAMNVIPVPLPPLAEQERIVVAIEEQFSRLDTAEKLLRSARRRADRMRTSVLTAAVAGDWPMKRFGDVVVTTSGGTPSRRHPEYYGGNIPWAKSGELRDGVVTSTEETISELGLANSSAKVFENGTLLIALYGATVGKLGMLGIDAATNQAVCAVIPHEPAMTPYLYIVLRQKRRELINAAQGGAQPNISQTILRELVIPVPPINEQMRIVAEAERQATLVDSLVTSLDHALIRSDHLRRSILESAFTGRLVPQGADADPAFELLARIASDHRKTAKPRRKQRA